MALSGKKLKDILSKYTDEELENINIVCNDEGMFIDLVTYEENEDRPEISLGWGYLYGKLEVLYAE